MIYLGLGSNLGDRLHYLNAAIDLLYQKGVSTIIRSSIYETEAWGNSNQAAYLNMVIGVHTQLKPHQLLGVCLETEAALGRMRHEKWGARVIDIDIILYDDKIISTENLVIPHPLFSKRKFVLQPLAEIAQNQIDPDTKKSIAELNLQCLDHLHIQKIK